MEMLMLLFYGGSCICYGILLVILVRMGLPSVLVRCLRMAGRRAVLFTRMVFRRHRGKTVRAGFVMAALAAGLAAGGTCRAAESIPEDMISGGMDPEALSADTRLEISLGAAGEEPDGIRYLRADNCGAVIRFTVPDTEAELQYVCGVDGNQCIREGRIPSAGEGSDAVWSEMYQPEEICVLGDGFHEYCAAVYADGILLSEVREPFILDTVPPVFSLRLETREGASVPEGEGDVRYIGECFRVILDVTDDHYDSRTTALRRVCLSDGSGEPAGTDAAVWSDDGHFEDLLTEDGIYQYGVEGADLAGNEPLPEDTGWLLDSRTSRLLVKDTESPRGSYAIWGQEAIYNEVKEDGAAAFTAEYPQGEQLRIRAEAEDPLSPVRISGWLVTEDGRRRMESSPVNQDSSPFSAELLEEIPQGASFRIEGVVLEDEAGNRTVLPDLAEMRRAAEGEDTEEDDPDSPVSPGTVRETAAAPAAPAAAAESTAESVKESPDSAAEILLSDEGDSSPSVSVRFEDGRDGNGCFFRQSRLAVIRADGRNFREDRILIEAENGEDGGWHSDGGTYVRKILFQRDGRCALRVGIRDRFGDLLPPDGGPDETVFFIDRKRPRIRITGIRNYSAGAEIPVITVRVTDRFAEQCSVRLQVAGARGGISPVRWKRTVSGSTVLLRTAMPVRDDYYRLCCEARDPAGGRAKAVRCFSLNRKGTVFEMADSSLKGRRLKTVPRPEVILRDPDEVTVLAAAVNGRDWELRREGNHVFYDNMPEEDGKYVLTMTVRDGAGHISSMEPVEFWLDRTAPVPSFLFPDGNSGRAVKVCIPKESEDDYLTMLLLDDTKILPDEETADEWTVFIRGAGTHTLSARMADAAGNLGEIRTCTVTVDDKPSAALRRRAAAAAALCLLCAAFIVILRKGIDLSSGQAV